MPIFMVERQFADELEASAEQADQINLINDEEGVRWLYSFLSADKRKTYCLYEAPFADSIRRAAERAECAVRWKRRRTFPIRGPAEPGTHVSLCRWS